MVYPDWRAGQIITADLLLAMNVYEVEQGADQSVTSSTTLQDTNLVIPVESNAVYEYRLLLSYTAATAGDAQIAWTVPTSATMSRRGHGLGQSVATSQTDADRSFSAVGAAGTAFGFGATGSTASFLEIGRIETSSNAGNATMQFAQRVSNATPSTLLAASRLFYRRVG